ncbi:MAG: hypothetical protein KF775_04095 [Cyclobacteriaceae bacterium]|nr:hypothetical protein [Cyclobacteriaceae bacterium]
MAHRNQIEFIRENRDLIREPILLVGAKIYDFDKFDLKHELADIGFTDVLGTDLEAGNGVDQTLDITDGNASLLTERPAFFSTIICMEVLTNVTNPFLAACHVSKMLRPDGLVILSECTVRKISKMPVDYWRFTYDGLKALFPDFEFDDARGRISITRQRDGKLVPYKNKLEDVLRDRKHPDESLIGFILRRIHRRFFSNGIFMVSRMLPEQTIYAVGRKSR